MRHFIIAATATLALSTSAQALTYNIDLQGFHGTGSSITGTMTYDSLGVVAAPSAWDLTITAPSLVTLGYNPLALSSANNFESADFSGLAGFTATLTALTLDMSSGASLYLYNNNALSGSELGLCFGCTSGADTGIGLIIESGQESFGAATGTLTIGTITAVPLPAGIALMVGAFGTLGGLRRIKQRAAA